MNKKKEPVDTPLWEKLVGLAGLVLLCIAIVVLVRNAISGDESPPRIEFENITIVADQNRFRVDVDVLNTGGTSVSDLEVEGRVTGPEGNIETSSFRFDYLPAHSQRAGGLFFETDPQQGNLQLHPKSYIEP